MQPFPAQPPLPAAWTQVLDKVDETLRKTGEAAAEREQAIGDNSKSADADAARTAQWQENLKWLQEQIEGWPAALARAQQKASDADAVLGAGEDALRRWLGDAEALAQRLAKWVAHEV